MRELYELKLHQSMRIGWEGVLVLRVPGGWVYFRKDSSVFVPFDNEFQT